MTKEKQYSVAVIEVADEPIIPGGVYDGEQRPSKQQGYLHQQMKYPTPFRFNVPEEGPVQPGWYMIAGNAFQPGQYGLDFRGKELRFLPLADGLAQLQAIASGK